MLMRTLYITRENSVLHKYDNGLVLKKQGRKIESISLLNIHTIVLRGNIRLTSNAAELILENGIDVLYTTLNGKITGRLMSMSGGGALLKLAQHEYFLNYNSRLELAKQFVTGKLKNQCRLIEKYNRYYNVPEYKEKIEKIKGYLKRLSNASEIDELMGFEGISAKIFWECYSRMLSDNSFESCSYRPAQDYVNAALNLGYACLANEITVCLISEKFDIEIGFLHSLNYGRNSLPLDIMEEFRTPFIDAWILKLFNKKMFNRDCFEIDSRGYRLNSENYHRFIELYHEHVNKGEWQEKFRTQVEKLKNTVINNEIYEPFVWD